MKQEYCTALYEKIKSEVIPILRRFDTVAFELKTAYTNRHGN